MTTEPRLEFRDERPAVGIPIEVALAEWSEATALVGELVEWLGQNGATLAGPPFFRYRRLGDEASAIDLEVGVPTERAVDGDGRVLTSSVPEGTYAVVEHEGHPDELQQSHEALQEWTANEGIELARRADGEEDVWDGRFEFYLTDPEEQPDRSQWTTEIAYLVWDDLPDELPAPARRALAAAGYTRIEQFTAVSEGEVGELHGVGPAALERLDRALADEGLTFADGRE